MLLSSEVCAKKIVPYSELMIFIKYEDNGYCFMHHTQGNIIFHSTHPIFDEGLFPNTSTLMHKSTNYMISYWTK